MELLKIYSPQNQILVDGVSDESFLKLEVMSDHNVTAIVESPESINFTVGCYLDFQGIRYTVRSKSDIQKDGTRRLEYKVVFESPQADSYKRTIRNPSNKQLKFPLTATPKEHIELIVWNLNQIGGSWTVGECIEAPQAVVSYNHTKCWDGVKTIADTFNTEFEFDCYNKKLHLRKVEYNKDNPLPLAYGRGNGFKPGLGRKSVDSRVPIEILTVQAGSRNIDASKNDNHPELFLPKGQAISFDGAKFEDEEGFDVGNSKRYIVDAEGLTIQRADKELVTYEDSSTDLSNIYPMRVGTITAVEVTDKGFYNIIDSSIPEDLDYSKYRIAGEEMVVAFQKAEMLSGREFKIMQTADKLTGYNHSLRRFMLVSDEQDGQTMPNSVFAPKVGDTYAVFGMTLPDEYVRDDASKSGASWDMFREAVKVLYEEEQEKFSFNGELDGKWAKTDWVNIGGRIGLGHYIRFTDDQIIESEEDNVLIRITGTKTYLNNPYSPEITLANVTAATYNDDFRKIPENEVKAETDNKNTVNFVRRSWRGMMELVDNIYDPSGSFQNDLISAVAIRSMMIALGDELLQYIFMDDAWTSEIDPIITYSTANKRIECSAANIRHMTLGIDSVQPNRSATEYLHWQIPAYNSAVLVDNPTQFYYLYLRVSKSTPLDDEGLKIGVGEWFLSSEKVEFDSDPNNYILLAAFINSEEVDNRQITPLYGFAELTPGMLRINKIVSTNGLNILDLLNGSAQLANGNLEWDALGNLLTRGLFESNKDGNKIVIDPTKRSLEMIDAEGNRTLNINFRKNENEYTNSSIEFIVYKEGQALDSLYLSPSLIHMQNEDNNISTQLFSNGYYVAGRQSNESSFQKFHLRYDNNKDRIMINADLPESPFNLSKGDWYYDGDTIKRKS